MDLYQDQDFLRFKSIELLMHLSSGFRFVALLTSLKEDKRQKPPASQEGHGWNCGGLRLKASRRKGCAAVISMK
jgi:hypothetical protein